MTAIYDQHAKHFPNVSAWTIHHKGKFVAKAAIKYPRDGAGRLYAYVHWIGFRMVRGHANGYGYDKGSAAVMDACEKLPTKLSDEQYSDGTPVYSAAQRAMYKRFQKAIAQSDSTHWHTALFNAGFNVDRAV